MLKLRRLRVERFRSLARGTELLFSDGINVLLGQNGTGKTTLLELISMVVRSDFTSVAKEELAIQYELADEKGESVIVDIQNKRVTADLFQPPAEPGLRERFRPSVEVRSGRDTRPLLRWSAEDGLSADDGDHPAVVEQLIPLTDPSFLYFFISELPAVREVRDILSGGLLRLINVRRFDESLKLFERITSTGDSEETIFVGGRFFTGHSWMLNPFAPPLVPEDLVEKLITSREPGRPDYSFTQNDLGFLGALKELMTFHASELRVDVSEQSQPKKLQVGNLVFRFRWEDGTLITHERLSYGQKRLVAFFYYLACNPDIVIADELVNGLHHRWITASIEALGQRQAFLTSQNPLLLDYIPITSEEQIRRSFVLCRSEPRAGRPGWLWDNMTEDDARELYAAYEVGVEHVSEILQSRGLW